MSEWQPIETAPKGSAHCLLAGGGEVYIGLQMNSTWWRGDYYVHRALPTHWMPLPKAPE